MPLELRDVDFADGPAIKLTYVGAFYEDEYNKTMFPNVSYDRLLAGALSRWPQEYGTPDICFKKVVDTDTGEIVGFSKWRLQNIQPDTRLPKKTGWDDLCHH